jgi:tol-pal system protein YbgF
MTCCGWSGSARRWAPLPMALGTALLLATLALSTVHATPAHAQNNSGAADAEVRQLRERVEQLEAQLVDMRVILGTLQSLAQVPARGGSAAQPSGGDGGGDSGRMSILEMQIQALTAQMERLADEVRALNGGGRRGSLETGRPSRFGTTTITTPESGGGDRIGSLIRGAQSPNSTDGVVGRPGGHGGAQDARGRYEEAYGYWLQGNLQAAELSLAQFVKDYATHELAGNAQFWLGEVHFKQGRYNRAAKEFLKVSQAHGSSRLAPDSLLRLAQSLDKLGHTQAACATLGELKQRYSDAPPGIVRKAGAEGRRLGC